MGILKISIVVFALCWSVALQINAQSDEEISNVLEKIFSPESESSIHARALRRDIVRRLYDALQREDLEDDLLGYKRSINSLARWDNLPGKRNLAALAKGGYIRTIPESDEEQEEEQDKRSLASLVRNGQLPHAADQEKRGIAALARNGELHTKRDIQALIDELYEKRNLGSLARSYNFPMTGKRYLGALMKNSKYAEGKRNLASLAREGFVHGKRNVAALLRQDKIHGPNDRSYDLDDQMQLTMGKSVDDGIEQLEKRNVGAAKANGYKPPFKRSVEASTRTKRSIDYYSDEYAAPVFQNQNVRDYEELMKALTGEYPPEKRFLGSVAKSGWFRPQASSRYVSRIDKRHIGSLARLGWLPAFRQIRRFSRSGRSVNDDDCDCRSSTTDGEVEDYAVTEDQLRVIPQHHHGNHFDDTPDDVFLDSKRFFVQPVVDKALLVDKVLQQLPPRANNNR